MTTTTDRSTLAGLVADVARTGFAPDAEEIERVVDRPPPAGPAASHGTTALPGVRRRLALDLARLADRAGLASADDDVAAIAGEYARYSSVPGGAAATSPGELADAVNRTPHGRTERSRVDERAAAAAAEPLRAILRAAATDGPPSRQALDALHLDGEGVDLEAWREGVAAACRDVRARHESGQQQLARQLADEYLGELSGPMVTPEPDEDLTTDPAALAARVRRTGAPGR